MAFTQSAKKPWKKDVVEVVGLFKKARHVFEANERGPGSTIGDFMIDGAPGVASLKCSHEVGNPIEGTRYRVSGYWSTYKSKSKWAKNKETAQFVAEVLEQDSEMEFESFSAYLCAIIREKQIPGIGMGRVSRLWKTFGKQALHKIRTASVKEFNAENPGMQIDASSWSMLAAEVTARQSTESTMAEILKTIAGFGFPKSIAKDAYAKWGVKAASKIRRNPFCLMTEKFQGAGFKRCDELFRALGGNPKRLKRLMLRIWYEIKGGVQGNVWTEERQLRSVVKDQIEAEFSDFGIPRDSEITKRLERAIALGVRACWLSREWTAGPFGGIIDCESSSPTKTAWIAPAELDLAEQRCAVKIARWVNAREGLTSSGMALINHLSGARLLPIGAQGALFTSIHQQSQLAKCLRDYGIGILTGGPGTGKTRTTCAFINTAIGAVSRDQKGHRILACGPTGKSVLRLRDEFYSLFKTSSQIRLPVTFSTWHRELWNPGSTRDVSVIIGDEESMMDIELLDRVLSAFPNAVILFVGDDGQLPPVGPGHVLRDMLNSKCVPVARLTETHRNEGGIVDICQAILDKKPWEPHGNVILNQCDTMEDAQLAIETRLAAASIEGFDPMRDVQVICAVNEKGDASKLAINARLQKIFQGKSYGDEFELSNDEQGHSCPFMLGDKVVCRKNGRYSLDVNSAAASVLGASVTTIDVCNGDQGTVKSIDSIHMRVELSTSRQEIAVVFNEPEPSSYHKNAKCHWELAYAISCHSSQGSEWPVVFVVLDPSSSASGICNLEWLRTALSRGKIRAEMFGTMETARKFCKKSGRDQRKTLLAERIQRECEILKLDL